MSMVVACGGGTESDTTSTTADSGDTSTTEETSTTESDDGETVGIGDIPEECFDAFVDYLQAIESTVEGVDWENATIADFEELGTALDPVTAEYEEDIANSQCEDIEVDATDEETFDFLIELAQDEAPGTVGYLEMIRDLAGSFGEDTEADVSGDCETDIAAMQAIVDQGGNMEDLSLADVTAVGALVTSISTNCSQDRSLEFFSQDDVSAFLGG